jgi:hypothetical protein
VLLESEQLPPPPPPPLLLLLLLLLLLSDQCGWQPSPPITTSSSRKQTTSPTPATAHSSQEARFTRAHHRHTRDTPPPFFSWSSSSSSPGLNALVAVSSGLSRLPSSVRGVLAAAAFEERWPRLKESVPAYFNGGGARWCWAGLTPSSASSVEVSAVLRLNTGIDGTGSAGSLSDCAGLGGGSDSGFSPSAIERDLDPESSRGRFRGVTSTVSNGAAVVPPSAVKTFVESRGELARVRCSRESVRVRFKIAAATTAELGLSGDLVRHSAEPPPSDSSSSAAPGSGLGCGCSSSAMAVLCTMCALVKHGLYITSYYRVALRCPPPWTLGHADSGSPYVLHCSSG